MKPFLFYTLARIGVFFATYAVVAGLWLLVGDGALPLLPPLLVAAVISAVVSYRLLRGPRARFAAAVDQRAQRTARRFEESRAREDVD